MGANKVSVIIPTLNAAGCVPSLVYDLSEGEQRGILEEIIVSDGGSQDLTLKMVREAGVKVISGASGRGGQLARGAGRATGDWLLFLHADSRLEPRWSAAVEEAIESGGDVFCFRLRFDVTSPPARLVAGWANLRTRLGLPYGDQGLLIARSVYDDVGGYDDLPLMEDVDLIGRLPGRPVMMDAIITTSSEHFEAQGWFRRGAANIWRLVRFWFGADPEMLARHYYGRGFKSSSQ